MDSLFINLVNVFIVIGAAIGVLIIMRKDSSLKLAILCIFTGVVVHSIDIIFNIHSENCTLDSNGLWLELLSELDSCLGASGSYRTYIHIWVSQSVLLAGLAALPFIYGKHRTRSLLNKSDDEF